MKIVGCTKSTPLSLKVNIDVIRNILDFEWDPIGVGAQGEFESYVYNLKNLLDLGASEKEVFNYLWTIETESLMLDGQRSHTLAITRRLLDLNKS